MKEWTSVRVVNMVDVTGEGVFLEKEGDAGVGEVSWVKSERSMLLISLLALALISKISSIAFVIAEDS